MIEPKVYCKNCVRLDLKSNPKPYCPWVMAYLEPNLLEQSWVCEGFKLKQKRG